MAAKPKQNETQWPSAVGFKDSWKKFKSEVLKEAMRTFNDCKRSIPPKPLPRGMKDHKLDGPLREYMECHLEGDALLIYKPLAGGAIKLLRVCTHDDLKGAKGKALAAALKKE
jgi:addiction module RelE/StbE family toxin